jgi:hypothetical protein
MSTGNPQDKTLEKRRRAPQRLSSRSRLKIHDPRETTRHDASKATLTQNIKPSKEKPREAIWHDAEKPVSSVATRIVATPM